MGKPGKKPKAKAVGEDPENIEPDLVKQHFDDFMEGNYDSLVPLGFACLERGWPTTKTGCSARSPNASRRATSSAGTRTASSGGRAHSALAASSPIPAAPT